jgi:hypothetical protein
VNPAGLVVNAPVSPIADGDSQTSARGIQVLPVVLTSVLSPLAGDFPSSPAGGEDSPAGLNAFLDLNPFSASAGNRTASQQPEGYPVSVVAVGEPALSDSVPGSEWQAVESGVLLSRADLAPSRDPVEGHRTTDEIHGAGDDPATTRERRGWSELVVNLLVVASIPLAWGCSRVSRNRPQREVLELAGLD